MVKKQASHGLLLYVLCAVLLGMLFIWGMPVQIRDEDQGGTPPPSKKELTIVDLPLELTDPFAMARIFEQAKILDANILSGYPDEEIFDNPFSPFTEFDHKAKKPQVVIIIDDMGVNPHWSKQIADLPGPLTLSYLPYAENISSQVSRAKRKGHDLMLHMPMQAMNGVMETTPGLLRVDDTQQDFFKSLFQNMTSFEGYRGINNHMGSRMTQNEPKMDMVMKVLKGQGLYFIDSRTIHSSIAANSAEQAGVPHLVRDVFLDHEDTIEYVQNALKKLEEKALKDGVAIAIGHPKENTYIALAAWLPTLKDKNITLIAAKDAIHQEFPNSFIQPFQKQNLPALKMANSAPDHISVPKDFD